MMVDYDVTESGIVVNSKTGKVLHQYKSKHGYLRVALYENGKQKRVFVHRLVAMKYIPNPHNLPQVNHKNGIKTDNRVENLEWCTASENQQHRRYVLKSGNRRVKRIETDTIYDSIKQAAEDNSSHIPNIVRACANNSTAAGFHWSYVWKEIILAHWLRITDTKL